MDSNTTFTNLIIESTIDLDERQKIDEDLIWLHKMKIKVQQDNTFKPVIKDTKKSLQAMASHFYHKRNFISRMDYQNKRQQSSNISIINTKTRTVKHNANST
jgi:hypothetical protein